MIRNAVVAQTNEATGLLGAFEGKPYCGNQISRNGTGEGSGSGVVHRDDCEGDVSRKSLFLPRGV